MILPIGGFVLGLVLGAYFPLTVPQAYAKFLSVALLASLDTVFGGLKAAHRKEFDNAVFISGFFTNGMLAAFLVYLGDKLGLDIYLVALLAFGFRSFKNLAILRRYYLKK